MFIQQKGDLSSKKVDFCQVSMRIYTPAIEPGNGKHTTLEIGRYVSWEVPGDLTMEFGLRCLRQSSTGKSILRSVILPSKPSQRTWSKIRFTVTVNHETSNGSMACVLMFQRGFGHFDVRCVVTITILNENDELTRPEAWTRRPEDRCPNVAFLFNEKFPNSKCIAGKCREYHI